MSLRTSGTIEKLIIGAPFGNWFGFSCATSTMGTYTARFRAGRFKRLWRVLSTVRFYPRMRACTNRLQLPNPGIDHFIELDSDHRMRLSDSIVSISARDNPSWEYMLKSLAAKVSFLRAVEMNVSCPNCPGEPDASDYAKIFELAVKELGLRVSVKLPPVGYEAMAELALSCGVQYLHCCNTLPTPAGGMSGKPLQPLSLAACRFCVEAAANMPHKPIIIGGGGITGRDDVRRFRDVGATHFAVASALFNPCRWFSLRRLAEDLANDAF